MNSLARVVWHRRIPERTPSARAAEFARLLESDWQSGGAVREVLRRILTLTDADEVDVLRAAAERAVLAHCGDSVRLRGLVEFSNRCVLDCRYCGIRRGNRAVKRFSLSVDDVVSCARWCADKGYGSLVLQSGERRDPAFVRRVETMIRAIKAATRSAMQPDGLGITLCVGEQSEEAYARWFEAGAHRYLLRIETSSASLFAEIHPSTQRHETRLACLKSLRALGYQVGTGVMIGLPGQTVEHLVDDLLFFRDMDVDMIGMGPYIPHPQAVLPHPVPDVATRVALTLRTIATTRLALPTVNIAATTALQTLAADGLVQGLRHGANVVMPQATPLRVRQQYTLYDGKACLDDSAAQVCIQIHAAGRRILRDAWGDRAKA